MITKEYLQEQISLAQQSHEVHFRNMVACEGAIQAYNLLIKQLEESESKD